MLRRLHLSLFPGKIYHVKILQERIGQDIPLFKAAIYCRYYPMYNIYSAVSKK